MVGVLGRVGVLVIMMVVLIAFVLKIMIFFCGRDLALYFSV